MTLPWIQVYTNMVTHNKTRKLAAELKLTSKEVKPNVIAAGMLLALWTWAGQNAVDGDITGVPPEDIADVAGWKKSPSIFFDALVKVGLIDVGEDGVLIHDWMEYSLLLHEQTENKKEKDRARAKAYRDRRKRSASSSQANHEDEVPPNECPPSQNRHGDESVTGTLPSQANHAPTIPNHTIPNLSSTTEGRKDIDSTSNVQRDDLTLPSAESWEEMKQRIEAERMKSAAQRDTR